MGLADKTGTSTRRGYELGCTNNQVSSVIKWTHKNTYRRDILSSIYFTADFPERWTLEQKLLAPLIAEYMYESYNIQLGKKKVCSLWDLHEYRTNKDFIPKCTGMYGRKISDYSICWSRVVKDYTPVVLFNEVNSSIRDFRLRSMHPSVYDIQAMLLKSGKKYTANAIAQAVSQLGYTVDIQVRVNYDTVYPMPPEHIPLNVEYIIRRI